METSNLATTGVPGGLSDKAFTLDPCLLDLVRLRVVQIHGCEWTLNEQTQRLKVMGETSHRLQSLSDWRNQTIFSDREKAALNLAEALTLNPVENVREELIQVVRLVFTEHEVVCIIAAILAVNDWFQTKGR
jgi:alkylhydroperoxidase family enzyme